MEVVHDFMGTQCQSTITLMLTPTLKPGQNPSINPNPTYHITYS